MKLLHLSDLHLGKRVNDFSMVEDQRYILGQILAIVEDERPDAVVIAGDVYDKTVPSAEAVELLDGFLYQLSLTGIPTFVISGNHDSAERLSFGSRLMTGAGVYVSPVYQGHVTPVTLRDEWGELDVYMLPFLKPVQVRRFFPDSEIETYTDGCRMAVEAMGIRQDRRNVLIAHQFVTGAARCESEELSVGGSDNVDAAVFADFDYVALGHIHGPQSIGANIRYCGTPLKYSFSEAGHTKSVTIAELGEKGMVTVRTVPLTPLHDLRELRGTYLELTALENYQGSATDDYLHIILTDEEDVPEAVGRLRVIYPNLMKLSYDNARTREYDAPDREEIPDNASPLELFCRLYETMNHAPMSDVQKAYVTDLLEILREGTP